MTDSGEIQRTPSGNEPRSGRLPQAVRARVHRSRAARFIVLLATLGILFMFGEGLLGGIGRWLDVSEPPVRSKYVMILGGGVENRPFAASALVELGWAEEVLVSEVKPPPEVEDQILPPEHVVTREILIRMGVPAERIHVLPGAHNSTFSEAVSLRSLLDTDAESRVLVVTDRCHSRRARWVFRRILGRDSRIRFVATPDEDFIAERWWAAPKGALYVPGEYLKLLFYTCRYGDGLWYLGGAFAVVLALVGIRQWRKVVSCTVG
ncbi:hypothetical protein JCM19992_17890 [Thermostilla marina]